MSKGKNQTSKNTPTRISEKKEAAVNQNNKEFLIVGMGASAGGLEAFKEFFSNVPKDSNMAFVLVQHLDPTHKSLMAPLLKSHTDMNVSEVQDRTIVAPNQVYVIPPNKDMVIYQGVLHLMEPSAARGFRRPIDFFLRSLAEDQMEKAVGIILSGTGTEGTLSLKDIKGHGGLSLVQNPETAKYDGMPRSAISSGAEDFVLPVNEMPDFLIKYAKNRKFKSAERPEKLATVNELLEKIFILLRQETGCNFGNYKISTVLRRIEKRMALNQIDKLENYFVHLQKNRAEVRKLFKELLIGVTSFFRDKEAFDTLQKKIIPELIDQKSDGDSIRIWAAGCSTGEEAYSLAILFDEMLHQQSKALKIQLFATDMDESAINFARLALYPETISADISPQRLSRYFIRNGTTYRVKKEIRDLVIFAEHNLIKDPPFSKQDFVSCRNLLIYLNVEAQKKVFAIFHYALNPDGYLFLGSSESLGEYADLFLAFDRKHKIFKHKETKNSPVADIGYLFREPIRIKAPMSMAQLKDHQISLSGITEKILLENYAPACAIIDGKGTAVYFHGDTGKYLQPSPGVAKLSIVDMAREGLKGDLRNIISKIRKSKKTEVRKNVTVKTNGQVQGIDIQIRPLSNLGMEGEYFMVTFEDRDLLTTGFPEKIVDRETDLSELQAMEQELAATKEYLRSTIEQLEISNEELKSSNEELQSSNEELQSTNEEMETSKEELQSVNEEIVTVNTELQGKIDELARAYDDMNNLLASTEIGTIFLDDELKIKRFTPSMVKIINLIQSDVGRPLEHLSSNLIYEGILDDVKNVLNKLTPYIKSVKSTSGAWYQMQIMPYRTEENVIEGVVITFVDITQEKQLSEQLKIANEQYEHLLEMTKTIVFSQDKDLKYTHIASAHPDFKFIKMAGKTDDAIFAKEDAHNLKKIKKKVLRTGKPFRQNLGLKIGAISRYFDFMVRPLLVDGKIEGIACTAIDISELLEAEKQLVDINKARNGK
jgi:two-component system CheB/CheR fusion protein